MRFVNRRIALASSLLLGVVSVGRAQTATAGTTFTMRTTIDSGGTTPKVELAMRRQVTAHRLRMEFLPSSGSPAVSSTAGMIMIVNDEDSTITTVPPGQQTAMITSRSMLGTMAPSMTENVTDYKLEDLGPGESILGHATHRYRVTTTGTFEMSMAGQTCKAPINAVSEQWVAPDVDAPIGDAMSSQGSSNMAGSVGVKRTGVPATIPKGAILRSISTMPRKGADGNALTLVTTSEVTELVQGTIDASAFAPPSGYRVMDMRAMMANLPPGAMEAAAARGAGDQLTKMCRSMGAP